MTSGASTGEIALMTTVLKVQGGGRGVYGWGGDGGLRGYRERKRGGRGGGEAGGNTDATPGEPKRCRGS